MAKTPKTVIVHKWVPDYTRKCECCGTSPVVTGETKGKVVYRGTMCGVCTWGESKLADPDKWNE